MGAIIGFGLSFFMLNTQIQTLQNEIKALDDNLNSIISTLNTLGTTVSNLEDDIAQTQSEFRTVTYEKHVFQQIDPDYGTFGGQIDIKPVEGYTLRRITVLASNSVS